MIIGKITQQTYKTRTNSIFNESTGEKRINSTWREGQGNRIKRVHEKNQGRTGPI